MKRYRRAGHGAVFSLASLLLAGDALAGPAAGAVGMGWIYSILAVVGVLALVRSAVYIVTAAIQILRRRREPLSTVLPDGPAPLVAVLVPAYNEGVVLRGSVESILRSTYPALEVVIIDDGSTDDTLAIARELALHDPRITVVAQAQNGGKAAALNAGLRASRARWVITVDADTELRPDTVGLLVAPLAHGEADVVCANVKVGNRERLLTRLQSLEYIVGLNLLRRSQETLDCITTVPGAAGAFSRTGILAAGGYSTDTVIEDTDLTIEMLARGARVVYQPAAVAFTEAPETFEQLVRQRARWAHGYLQVLVKHRRLIGRRGGLGLFGMPNLLWMHIVDPLASVLAVAALVHTLVQNPLVALTAAAIGAAVQTGWVLIALAIDRERPTAALISPLLLYAWLPLIWLAYGKGFVRLLAGTHEWDKLRRTGHASRRVLDHVRAACAEVFGVEQIGEDAALWQLGDDRHVEGLTARLEVAIGVPVPSETVRRAATPAALAHAIERELATHISGGAATRDEGEPSDRRAAIAVDPPLVASATEGAGAFAGVGGAITRDVPADALALVSRGR